MSKPSNPLHHLSLVAALRSGYDRAALRGDLVAGLTTAVMLIPQGMAYAMLAGLPPIVGLYASVLPLAVYAMLGTSRQLAVGPAAMVSLLVASGVGTIAQSGTEAYVAYAVVMAAMVGAMQFSMGLGRLGFLVNFLSRPVISGYASAVALVIGLSQLSHLLGLSLRRTNYVHEIVIEAVQKFDQISLVTTIIGVGGIAVLALLKKFAPAWPRALVVVVVGTIAVYLLGLDEPAAGGVAIVGEVPAGLPSPRLPVFDLAVIGALWPTALAISLVGFMESISVAKTVARKQGYEVDPNRELMAIGAANIASGFFQGYPITGGFSRTAVNTQAGAKSGLASLVTAAVVALSLVFFTPLFFYLPRAVLAALIMSAVFGLIDVAVVRHLWTVNRGDLALLALTFVATLTLGIVTGILTGVGASLFWFVVRTTRPHTAVLGRLPGTEVYRNVERFAEAELTPGVLTVRVDAQFYFGNVTFLKQMINEKLAAAEAPVRAVVLDAHGVNNLDSSADAALHEIYDDLEDRKITLYMAGVKGPVRDAMRRSGLWERLDGRLTLTVHEAVQRAAKGAAGGSGDSHTASDAALNADEDAA